MIVRVVNKTSACYEIVTVAGNGLLADGVCFNSRPLSGVGSEFDTTVIDTHRLFYFVTGSVVRWKGSDRPTMSNGSVNGLIAQISASDIAAAGTAAVTVF